MVCAYEQSARDAITVASSKVCAYDAKSLVAGTYHVEVRPGDWSGFGGDDSAAPLAVASVTLAAAEQRSLDFTIDDG